jgi:hypothetical protein
MTNDIVNRLRTNRECLAPCLMDEAADTIERLTAERNEARRELCRWSSFYYEEHIDLNEGPPRERDLEEAERRGWDCFKEDGE